jgi:hypothetical protein
VKKLIWLVPLGLALSVIAVEARDPGKDKDKEKKKDAPEFDVRASGAALALLAGGVLLLSDLRRRNDPEHD